MKRAGTGTARKLRRMPSDAEKRFWSAVRARQVKGAKFRRRHPIAGFVVDIVRLEEKLIVEIDGGQHAGSAADAARTEALTAAGFRVVRFWNNDVLNNLSGVLETLGRAPARG